MHSVLAHGLPGGDSIRWGVETRRVGDVALDGGLAICMVGDSSVVSVGIAAESCIPIQRGAEAISLREMAALVRDV